MASPEVKRFDEPDELITLPHLTEQVVVLGEVYVARTVLEPGWSWAEHVKPVVGTPSCLHHHQGLLLSGRMEFETDDGARRLAGPGDVFDVPPGHNAWVSVTSLPCRSSSPGCGASANRPRSASVSSRRCS